MQSKTKPNHEYPILEEVTLSNGNMEVTIIPSANMVISSLKYKDVESLAMRSGLKGYIENLSSYAFPFMAPWINRMTTTEYDFDGNHYNFSIEGKKVDENGYAMHGLLTANPNWNYAIEQDKHNIVLTGIFDYNESVAGFDAFPFKHEIKLSYILGKASLEVRTEIINKHEGKIPVAFGFHPHFSEAKRINVYGTAYRIPVNSKTIPVAPSDFNPKDCDTTVDMCKMMNGWHVDLTTTAGNMKITTNNYPYMLIWSPPKADYVAIEPMTSNIDFFNTDGTVIDKNETYEATYRVSF